MGTTVKITLTEDDVRNIIVEHFKKKSNNVTDITFRGTPYTLLPAITVDVVIDKSPAAKPTRSKAAVARHLLILHEGFTSEQAFELNDRQACERIEIAGYQWQTEQSYYIPF